MLALAATGLLALQSPAAPAAAPEAAPPPASESRQVTVLERTGEDPQEVPLNSRIGRPLTDNSATDPAAAMYLREWADCIVRMKRPRALSLLSTPLNSLDQARIIDQITGHRFTRRTICARFRYMRIDNLVLRGAIAEALWRWEVRRRQSAGPLAVAAAAAAIASDADLPALIAQLGRCIVDRDPEGAARVMATRPASRASREALTALSERVTACAPPRLRTRNIHPLTLRGALGEPFYMRRRSAAGEAAIATSSS